MEAHLAGVLPGIMMPEGGAVTLKREEFISLRPALRRRVLKKAVDALGVESSALSSVQLNEAVSFLSGARTGRSLRLPPGLSLEREYDRFVISAEETAGPFTHALVVPGVTRVPELGLEVETWIQNCGPDQENSPVSPFSKGGLSASPPFVKGGEGGFEAISIGENYRWQAVLDYDKIGFLLTLRNRRPGDRFCPSGMQGRQKKNPGLSGGQEDPPPPAGPDSPALRG
jgi:tRNA(Ile)-lysidine synthase